MAPATLSSTLWSRRIGALTMVAAAVTAATVVLTGATLNTPRTDPPAGPAGGAATKPKPSVTEQLTKELEHQESIISRGPAAKANAAAADALAVLLARSVKRAAATPEQGVAALQPAPLGAPVAQGVYYQGIKDGELARDLPKFIAELGLPIKASQSAVTPKIRRAPSPSRASGAKPAPGAESAPPPDSAEGKAKLEREAPQRAAAIKQLELDLAQGHYERVGADFTTKKRLFGPWAPLSDRLRFYSLGTQVQTYRGPPLALRQSAEEWLQIALTAQKEFPADAHEAVRALTRAMLTSNNADDAEAPLQEAYKREREAGRTEELFETRCLIAMVLAARGRLERGDAIEKALLEEIEKKTAPPNALNTFGVTEFLAVRQQWTLALPLLEKRWESMLKEGTPGERMLVAKRLAEGNKALGKDRQAKQWDDEAAKLAPKE